MRQDHKFPEKKQLSFVVIITILKNVSSEQTFTEFLCSVFNYNFDKNIIYGVSSITVCFESTGAFH